MSDGDDLASLVAESEALAVRSERARAAIEALRSREAAAREKARARQRLLVALERRGIVGGSLLSLVGTQFMGFRMGLAFGQSPTVANAMFALAMASVGLALAVIGWHGHVKEQAMLTRARTTAARASLPPAPPRTRVDDLDAGSDDEEPDSETTEEEARS
jgi:hypothetical protein